jgi:hypothetical protein
MKVIIAPSKSMKYVDYNIKTTDILYKDENSYLYNILKQYNDEEIMSLMKISYKQAIKVMNYFQDNKVYPAISLYSGTVFKQLNIKEYTNKEYDYMDKYLNIMSAYYGVLKYNSAIHYYRLDMTMKPNQINLYDYWFTPIYQYFENEDFIISLASKEFSTMIKHPHLIFIDFIIIKNNKQTRNSFKVKEARGKMLNYMIINQISTLEDIKSIIIDEYVYDYSLSNDNTLAFVKYD